MKKNEIIELDGKEYTLELNRESFLQIDKLCNIDKSFNIMQRGLYEYMDDVEIDDNFDIDKMSEELRKRSRVKGTNIKESCRKSFLYMDEPYSSFYDYTSKRNIETIS